MNTLFSEKKISWEIWALLLGLFFLFLACGKDNDQEIKAQTASIKVLILSQDLDLSNITHGSLVIASESLSYPIIVQIGNVSSEIEYIFNEIPTTEYITFYAVFYDTNNFPIYEGLVVNSIDGLFEIVIYLAPITNEGKNKDTDGDGVPDDIDNCILLFNPGQEDICSEDRDSDGIKDELDNCWENFNPDQSDIDEDDIGDLCDTDDDNDELLDEDEVACESDPQDQESTCEICDGEDNDLDGLTDEGFDLDEDGYTICDGDCDDADPSINPGADEILDDWIDQDCDGFYEIVFPLDSKQSDEDECIYLKREDDFSPPFFLEIPSLVFGDTQYAGLDDTTRGGVILKVPSIVLLGDTIISNDLKVKKH